MRAAFAPLAVLMLVSIGVCGCRSRGNTWDMLSWGRNKTDASAISDAPKYNPKLPSAGQVPGDSTAALSSGSGLTAGSASGFGPPGTAGGYPAVPAGYQNAVYPTTPYEPAKIGAATGGNAVNNWNGGSLNPGPAVGLGASAGSTGYSVGNPVSAPAAQTSNATGSVYGNNMAGSATPPSYSANTNPAVPTTGGVQPQSGLYNPAYDGGQANRYVSGAPIPAAGAVPNYRTADARSALGGVQTAGGGNAGANAAGSAAASGSMVGDRYANTAAGPSTGDQYLNSSAGAAVAGAGDRYQQPPADYRAGSTGYDPGNNGYQPGVTPNPPGGVNAPGNTGYNPPDVYSPSGAAVNPANPGSPVRRDPGYRPGGTGNYAPASGTLSPPNTSNNSPSDGRSQPGGVTPASYQAAAWNTGRSQSGLSSATTAANGPYDSEVYGAYQGTSSSSEPAYGPPNPAASPPGLLPAQSW